MLDTCKVIRRLIRRLPKVMRMIEHPNAAYKTALSRILRTCRVPAAATVVSECGVCGTWGFLGRLRNFGGARLVDKLLGLGFKGFRV